IIMLLYHSPFSLFSFFSNVPATTDIYTLSLHDALPISAPCRAPRSPRCSNGLCRKCRTRSRCGAGSPRFPRSCVCGSSLHGGRRSEEHTSELQSRSDLVCRLLLEKKKKKKTTTNSTQKR